ncbi:MAG: hypothetical protein ABJD11_01675 [Gemmatimonadota bacterium]
MMLLQGGAQPTPGLMIAALLASLPIVGAFIWAGVKVLGPISQAIAHRIAGRTGAADEMRAELTEVHRRLDEVQQQLAETHERLDFAERLLARGDPGERLPEHR